MVWTLIAAAALASASAPAAAQQPAGEETIISVSGDDAEMNAAKAQGRATLPEFYRRLASPAADEREFMVKFDIDPSDEVEYVWATDLDRSGTPMTGVLVNQPVNTSDHIGDRVRIREADIIDWAYRRGRVVQGAFTQRVLLPRMDAAEAQAVRDYLGW